jgi:hypothetical protein
MAAEAAPVPLEDLLELHLRPLEELLGRQERVALHFVSRRTREEFPWEKPLSRKTVWCGFYKIGTDAYTDPGWVAVPGFLHGHLHSLRTIVLAYGTAIWHDSAGAMRYLLETHVSDLSTTFAINAAAKGRLESLRVLCEYGQLCPRRHPYDAFLALKNASAHGHLECLRFLVDHFRPYVPWDASTAVMTAAMDQLECLKFLRENGCPWNDDVFRAATGCAEMEVVEYLHEIGSPGETACEGAALAGSVERLEFLRARGYPWGGAFYHAATRGRLDCMRWMHEHGCPWGNVWDVVDPEIYPEIAAYLEACGCPQPSPS